MVVDILCELTGDCPANCGGGAPLRQLGLVDNDEGRGAGLLHLPTKLKNATAFSGTVVELIGFCGKQVVADGLYSTNLIGAIASSRSTGQFVREAPDGEWRAANRFLGKWANDNDLLGGQLHLPRPSQWFRHDPTVARASSVRTEYSAYSASDSTRTRTTASPRSRRRGE